MRFPRWKTVFAYGVLCAGLILSLFALTASTLTVRDVSVTDPRGKTIRTDFPYFLPSVSGGIYRISGTMRYGPFSQSTTHIVVDDCLENVQVNGKPVPLPYGNQCKTDKGFDMSLGNYLSNGNNTIVFTVRDFGGTHGVYLGGSARNAVFLLYTIDAMLFGGALLLLVFKRIGIDVASSIVLLWGICVRLWYLSYTPFDIRTQDLGGHLEFISYVFRSRSLPQWHECWECHQQPLFYVVSAMLRGGVALLGQANWYLWLQVIQIGFFCMLGIVVALLFRRIFPNRLDRALALAIVYLWPSAIIHSVRLENDILYYVTYGIAMVVLYRWFVGRRRVYFLLAVLAMTIALFVKTTALPLVAVAVFVYAVHHHRRLLHAGHALSAVLLMTILIINFLPYLLQSKGPSVLNRITKSNDVTSAMKVGNTAYHYYHFDAAKFFGVPYSSAWSDATGRQFFINHLLKTSLFGDFAFETPLNRAIAVILGGLLVLGIGYVLVLVFLVRAKDKGAVAFFGLNAVLLLGMILFYRYQYPLACNNDFRFILPVLIPSSYFYVTVIRNARERGWTPVVVFGYVVAFLFLALSGVFFISYPLLANV